MKIFLSSILIMLSIKLLAQECSSPEWVFPPRMESKILILRIKSLCNLNKEGNFESLKEFFIRQITESSKIVHNTSESNFNGLPSTNIDSTIDQKAEEDDMTVRYLSKVATNGADQLIFDKESKQIIEATGNSEYVTKLYTNITVKSTSSGASMEVIQETRIRKPGFVPEGMFISEASKGVKRGFKEFLKDSYQDVSVNF